MRTVIVNTHKTTVKETFKEAPETHYVSVYSPTGQYIIGFMNQDEAIGRSKSLIPLIDSTRNGIKINRAEKGISEGRS